ncbi:MAG: hypothetical protein ACTS3F_13655 [Phycisphaerales bacterium]
MLNFMKSMGLAGGAAALLFAVGCSSNTSGVHQGDEFRGVAGGRTANAGQGAVIVRPAPVREAEPAPAPRTTPAAFRGSCAPQTPAGYNASGLAFPTGDASSSAIMLYQMMPATARANSEFEFFYQVCNLTSGTLQNVVVQADSIENITLVDSDPAFQRSAGGVVFPMGDLGPNESRIISVTGRAGSTGMGSGCISVTYNNVLCQTVQFVEPQLQLAKTISPQPQVLRCDPITISYRVTNPGSGVAQGVRVRDTLPNCMRLVGGGSNVDVEVGDLGPGESRDISVNVEAVSTGTCSSQAVATAAGDLRAESGRPEITIVEPVLSVDVECPGRTFLGRTTTFTYTVENTGNGPSNNTMLTASIPAGTEFVSATQGGTMQGGSVVWNLGTLAPGATRSGEVTVRGASAVTLTARATVTGDCAASDSDECQTDIEGIPAMLLDGFDDPDPIELGQTTTYTLTVTNQGSADLTRIEFDGVMAEGFMEFVSATTTTPQGSVSHTARGNVIDFAPVARLAPGETATYRITVRAIRAGQVSFRSEAVSNEITVPLFKSETTNFFE